jgi:L-malate glycosyltransferase
MAQKQRLLHVFATFAVGGPQVRAVQLMNIWGDRFEHGIVASDGRYDALELIDPAISAAVVQDYPPMKGRGLWRTLRSTGAYLKNSRWDLLVSYNWGAMETALANRLFAHLPHVHHEEGFGPDEPMGHNPKRALFRRLALAKAQALIVPSSVMVGIAKNKWGFSPPFVQQLANGVDMSLYTHTPAADVLAPRVKNAGDIWIGCVSGLRPEKNVRRLVRVAAPLLKAQAHVHVVICGTGAEEQAIVAEAAAAGVAGQVHLMGFQAHPHRYMGLFDILAIPSDTEQFPICEVEAMAAGVAICGTDVGDVKAILPQENKPYIVPVAAEAAFTEKLRLLVEDALLRQQLGRVNRTHVAKNYSLDETSRAFLGVFGQAMSPAAKPDPYNK